MGSKAVIEVVTGNEKFAKAEVKAEVFIWDRDGWKTLHPEYPGTVSREVKKAKTGKGYWERVLMHLPEGTLIRLEGGCQSKSDYGPSYGGWPLYFRVDKKAPKRQFTAPGYLDRAGAVAGKLRKIDKNDVLKYQVLSCLSLDNENRSLVYLATVTDNYDNPDYAGIAERVGDRFPECRIIEPAKMDWDLAQWEIAWEHLKPRLSVLVVWTRDDFTVGRGVYREILDAQALNILVWIITQELDFYRAFELELLNVGSYRYWAKVLLKEGPDD